MKLNIKATNIKLNPALSQYINEKIGGLSRLIRGLSFDPQVWIEVGTTTKHHKSGPIYRAEIQMHLPQKSLRVESNSEDIYFAVNEAKEKLERELKEYKDKEAALQKRTGRILKTIFQAYPFAGLWQKGLKKLKKKLFYKP